MYYRNRFCWLLLTATFEGFGGLVLLAANSSVLITNLL